MAEGGDQRPIYHVYADMVHINQSSVDVISDNTRKINIRGSAIGEMKATQIGGEAGGNVEADGDDEATYQARIKTLERKLKKPLKDIGYKKSVQLVEELQNLRGSDDLDILLQLAECHLNLMSDKKDSSIANVERFISTSGSRSASDVREMAYGLQQQGHYVQATILYKISHDLHKKEKKSSPDEELEWISDRVTDIQRAINPMAIKDGISRDIAKSYYLEYMNEMLSELREIENASPDVKALKELSCLVNITSSNNRVGEYEKSIELGEEGTTMMKKHFKEKVSNYKYYGWLLHNLGIAYRKLGQYLKAESCYVTAIEVDEIALDYENEKERQESIEWTKGNLEGTHRHIAKPKSARLESIL